MITDETPTTIALQPETVLEQQLLSELFTRLTNIGEAPSHPEKVGTTICYYTLDLSEYELDDDLFAKAECGVNEHGKIDPEPGSRALVVQHDEPEQPEESTGEIQDPEPTENPNVGDFTPKEAEVAEELVETDTPISELEYDELQEYAKRVNIAANQSSDVLRDAMYELANGWVAAAGEFDDEDEIQFDEVEG